MTTRAGRAAAALLTAVAVLVASPVFAQGAPTMPDPTETFEKPGTAVVRGRVLGADTGLPLRRAAVALRHAAQGQGGLSALTDEEGTFVFDAVPAGRYRLSASKTRYVDTALGGRAPGRPGRVFELAPGQKLEGVTLRLPTAGVISGRVVDDTGEPVANASVVAQRQRTINGEVRLTPAMHWRSTDDTGAFRIFGLPPGRYVVAVRTGHAHPTTHDLVDTSETAFAPTYYPSTPVASEAQPIDLVAGGEAFADIALVPTRVTSVSGEVVDASGRPAKIGFVNLVPWGAGEPTPGNDPLSGVMRENGTFTVSAVPAGDYTLIVQAIFGDDELMRIMTSGNMQGSTFTLPLTVTGAAIADLRVVVPAPIEVAGRVLFEGGPPPGGPPVVSVFATSTARGEMTGPRVQVGADGRFTMGVRPGGWRFLPWTSSGWMPKRLTFRGRSVVPGDPVEVDAEPGARLEILLTSQVTVVTGTASDADGHPVEDYHVVVFPADREKPSESPFRTRAERADAQGRFRLEALLPGEYLVAAVTDYEPNEQALDDEFLDSLRATATPVRLGDGAAEHVSLKVSLAP